RGWRCAGHARSRWRARWPGRQRSRGAGRCGAGRTRHRCRRHGRGRGRALELAQSRVEIDVEVALALLRFVLLVRQHLDLAAQPRAVALQQLDLVEQLDEALRLELRLERGNTVIELLLDDVEPLVGGL